MSHSYLTGLDGNSLGFLDKRLSAELMATQNWNVSDLVAEEQSHWNDVLNSGPRTPPDVPPETEEAAGPMVNIGSHAPASLSISSQVSENESLLSHSEPESMSVSRSSLFDMAQQ